MTAPKLTAGGMIVPTNGGGNRYVVRSILGNGGAVVTYQCTSAAGKEVAVKLYDPAVAAHSTVMKSLEQAYAATNNSPVNSAAPIIDAGFDEATVAPFSVTELILLPSLAAQQRRFAPDEVVALLKGLARSLDLAHVRPVVHGAIKPTNVFAGASSNPVIVTDFAANLPKAAVPSQEGFLISAPWIAPEQAQSGSVTPAADVFSVGLLVFYALTGRTYWRSTQGQTFDLAGWQQELAAPRSPASQRAAELGVPLSPTLDMVIWKALSNDPNERFRSIGEFASVLEDSLRQQQSVGSAATMALPIIGDAPSPLPKDMRNPEGPRPNSGPMAPANPHAAATMALTADQLMPPQGMQMQQGQMMNAQMQSMQMQQGQQMMNAPQGAMQNQQGQMPNGQYGQGMTQLGMQTPPGVPQPSPSQAGAYAYSQNGQGGRDPGYPPPPLANPNPAPKSKLLPVIIGFTGIALLGLVGTFVFLKMRAEKELDETPVNVATTVTASATTAPTTPPAPTPSVTESAPPPVLSEVSVKCKPACDEIKVDGAIVDATKPLKLAPGTHDLELKKEGYLPATEKITVKDGPPSEQIFTLTPEKKQAATTTPTATTAKTTTTATKPPCKRGFLNKCP